MSLVERSGELASLRSRLTRALGREGSTVAVSGEAGIGKTTLLDALVSGEPGVGGSAPVGAGARSGADGPSAAAAGSSTDGLSAAAAGILADGPGAAATDEPSEPAGAPVRVLRAAAGELEDDVAFGVVRDLLGPLIARDRSLLSGAAALAAPVFDATADAGDLSEASAVLHGLYWLVVNASEAAPLLLVVDDVQWADGASLRFLAHLAQRLDALPCLLALGLRASPGARLAPGVEALLSAPQVERLELAPLGVAGVAELVSAQLGSDAIAPTVAAACRDATGGNPFLVASLASELARAGGQLDASAVEALGGAGVLVSVRGRLARAGGAAASAVATATAVLGPSATRARVGALADVAPAALDELIAALASEGVLVDAHPPAPLPPPSDAAPQADTHPLRSPHPTPSDAALRTDAHPLAFSHPILRAAVLDQLDAGRQARLHARAALLMAADGDEEEAAHHLRLAEPLGDRTAVAILRRAAARALARGAAETAIAYFERALAEPPPPAARGELLYELGLAEAFAGSPADAATHLEQAREAIAQPQPLLATALAETQMWASRWVDAAATVERALRATTDPHARSMLETALLMNVSGSGPARAAAASRLAELRSRRSFGAGEEALMGGVAVELAVTDGPAERVVELATRALAAGALLRDPHTTDVFVLSATVLAAVDGADVALAAFDEALEHARSRGLAGLYGRTRALRAWVCHRFGRLVEAEADAREALGLMDSGVGATTLRPLALGALVATLLEREDADAAQRALTALDGLDPDVTPDQPLRLARAQLSLAANRADEALIELDACRRWEDAFGGRCPGMLPWRNVAVRARLALGDGAVAVRLASEQRAAADAYGAATVVGGALHADGLARRDGAVLSEAVSVLERSPARLALAEALIDFGALLRSDRRPAAAREPLRRGLELAVACGSRRLSERAAEELRVAGGRPRRRRASGVEALTPAELRAVRLAARGLTNREIAQAGFVAPRTVEMHLSNAYRKLDVQGREQLATALGEDA